MAQTPTITLERVEHPAQTALALGTTIPGKSGWVATLDFADGSRLIADKVDGESCWLVNGEWKPGTSMPTFWNGQLSRCTRPVMLSVSLTDAVEREHIARLVLQVERNRSAS